MAAFLQGVYKSPQKEAYTSVPLMAILIRQYRAWEKGIPPTTEWRGRGGQNPRLLYLFARLDEIDRGEAG